MIVKTPLGYYLRDVSVLKALNAGWYSFMETGSALRVGLVQILNKATIAIPIRDRESELLRNGFDNRVIN